MVKKASFILVLQMLLGICLQSFAQPHNIEVVVHRGANHIAPENTVESAIAALDNGATWIELDVRRSKDGVMYNLHDDTLDRTTDGKGKLSNRKSAYIDKLDAGSWFSEKFKGTKVPRIAEMLDALKGKANVFFDVKEGTNLKDLVAMVREKGWTANSFFWFGDTDMQNEFCRLAPEMKLKLNASSIDDIKKWMKTCRTDYVEVAVNKITPEMQAFCRHNGIKLMAALMSEGEDSYRQAIEMRPDFVNIDQPEVFTPMKKQWDAEMATRTQIAFISDAHVQDVVGHPELVRSQEVQVQSTRLFNENYFALCAALDDCGKRGIKLVVLPGDLTDNGQYVNQTAVRDILNKYGREYGMSFFVCFGNHDPSRPYGSDNTGVDYLATDGSRVTISSTPIPDARYNPELKGASIEDQTACYADFGFFPRKDYLFWATPFSSYSFGDYDFAKAEIESAMKNRRYALNDSLQAYDASYVVEPQDGIWILSLDGSVYLPKGMKDGKLEYNGSGLGYNNVLKNRKHLVEWVKTVAAEAKKRGKALITFCHYPIVDFNDGANDYIIKSWGALSFDLERTPSDEITKAMMDAGLRLHFGGHMHVNDTGIKTDDNGTLFNVQVPSPAMYVPAYKILTIKDANHFEVNTIVLEDVPGFDSLFPLYQKEYDNDMAHGKKPIWSIEALKSKSFAEFCDWQFRDLTRVRFIPRDLPKAVQERILDKNGLEILHQIDPEAKGSEEMKDWTGFDIMLDLYRLRYAGELARRNIPCTRLEQYDILFDAVEKSTEESEFIYQMRCIGGMIKCFLNEEPSINFSINLE